jgi:hypothetical protein
MGWNGMKHENASDLDCQTGTVLPFGDAPPWGDSEATSMTDWGVSTRERDGGGEQNG